MKGIIIDKDEAKRERRRKDEIRNAKEFLRRILPESEYEAVTTLTAWERRQAEWN